MVSIIFSILGRAVDENGDFTQVANCIRDQYNNIILDELMGENRTLNGSLTLEDDLADNFGLLAAYTAYKNGLDNEVTYNNMGLGKFCNDQWFFLAYAQVLYKIIFYGYNSRQCCAFNIYVIYNSQTWCEVISKEGLREQLDTDEHGPNRYRILGAPEFKGICGSLELFARLKNESCKIGC